MSPVRTCLTVLILFLAASLITAVSPAGLHAQSKAQIESQIDEHNDKIEDLEKEIAAYQQQLTVLGAQKNTLQSAIKTIDVSRQQTSTKISVTQNHIAATNLKLRELTGAISEKEYLIELDKQTVAASLRNIDDADDVSVVEQLFSANTLADAWEEVDHRVMLSNALREHANSLAVAKQELTFKKIEENGKKQELTTYSSELVTQKRSLDVQKSEKDRLLAQTKSQESAYQALIAKKQAERKAFEAELANLENSLKAVSAGSAPAAGAGVLLKPVAANFSLTQGYGLTSFARGGAYGYDTSGNPNPHTGLDYGVPVGTPVKAAGSGTVRAWGNTDAVANCYSFGKWILVDHPNGLSTAYLHLSEIRVAKGQTVSAGDTIALSGNSGYSTGPHLHFSVYVQQGVQVMNLGDWYTQTGRTATTACARGGAIIPAAHSSAYLDPTKYL
ncbi:MAG TPA: peptidoglycan DD-metalloendopeptidase family protein [Candidatus Paceibacterota bacterium]|nr:peptidoglycan DD-metalloendopeptidase family protein [Candidatus Paceibacterota bacterium]